MELSKWNGNLGFLPSRAICAMTSIRYTFLQRSGPQRLRDWRLWTENLCADKVVGESTDDQPVALAFADWRLAYSLLRIRLTAIVLSDVP